LWKKRRDGEERGEEEGEGVRERRGETRGGNERSVKEGQGERDGEIQRSEGEIREGRAR
jgi:hypothetical protein